MMIPHEVACAELCNCVRMVWCPYPSRIGGLVSRSRRNRMTRTMLQIVKEREVLRGKTALQVGGRRGLRMRDGSGVGARPIGDGV
jgi:hypothetical protein